MHVKQIMSSAVVTTRPETPLKEVAASLAEHHISGVPVVDERGTILGVVSEADILVKERGPRPRHGGIGAWILRGGVADPEKLKAVSLRPGAIYGLVSPTWGAYPGHTPEDIQSGSGVVHNTWLFDHPEKSVVRAPFPGCVVALP